MSDTAAEDANLLQRQLARLLWRSNLASGLTADERKASWAETRRDHVSRAGKMLRLMGDEGIGIALADSPSRSDAA